ncbi:MAG: glutamate racemase [Candidatus Bathyarchaeia archaeon]
MGRDSAIGVFDSGFGGLSLVKEIFKQLPNEEIIYFADTARCPYGVRPFSEVRGFVIEIIEFLRKKGVKMVVIACNTATAAGLEAARARFSMPVVGVIEHGAESAVKTSRNSRIGVIATEGTVKSGAYQAAISLLNPDALVLGRPCQEFVGLVEEGRTEGEEVERMVLRCLSPLLKEEIDTLVLGCTHFPFLRDEIRKVIGEGVKIVDPAVQTVAHVGEILRSKGLERGRREPPVHRYYTTGDTETSKRIGGRLLGSPIGNVRRIEVREGEGASSLLSPEDHAG